VGDSKEMIMRTQKFLFSNQRSLCVFPDEPASLAQAFPMLGLEAGPETRPKKFMRDALGWALVAFEPGALATSHLVRLDN
jgi:hypothetical protein